MAKTKEYLEKRQSSLNYFFRTSAWPEPVSLNVFLLVACTAYLSCYDAYFTCFSHSLQWCQRHWNVDGLKMIIDRSNWRQCGYFPWIPCCKSMVYSHQILNRCDLCNNKYYKYFIEDRTGWCNELMRRAHTSPAKDAETPWIHAPHLHLWYHSIRLDKIILYRCRRIHSWPCVGRCPPLSMRKTDNGCFHRGERWRQRNSKP